MAEDRKIFSLLEVTQSIQRTLAQRYTTTFWVKAEMNKLNHYPHSGHCYPELVEKQDGKIVAQIRANLWKGDYERINTIFLHLLKEPLRDGIHIMFSAKIQYDPVYGLSLRIVDIDPNFSLGELEREKLETIEKLRNEALFDLNRSTHFPLLPKRIAIISVETSKGYADFSNVIDGNPWGYRYFQMLFPALLQGDKAAENIVQQLKRILKVVKHFDVVAIIRGGGGDVGLSCYNNYTLAKTIATFPIPVLTGIGHSTNETVSEMVAYKNAITPTELADFLIQHFHNFAVPVRESARTIRDTAHQILSETKSGFHYLTQRFRVQTRHTLSYNLQALLNQGLLLKNAAQTNLTSGKNELLMLRYQIAGGAGAQLNQALGNIPVLQNRLRQSVLQSTRHESKNLELCEKSIALLDPENVLKRGYSITFRDGKLIQSIRQLSKDDLIETRLSDGTIISKVQK